MLTPTWKFWHPHFSDCVNHLSWMLTVNRCTWYIVGTVTYPLVIAMIFPMFTGWTDELNRIHKISIPMELFVNFHSYGSVKSPVAASPPLRRRLWSTASVRWTLPSAPAVRRAAPPGRRRVCRGRWPRRQRGPPGRSCRTRSSAPSHLAVEDFCGFPWIPVICQSSTSDIAVMIHPEGNGWKWMEMDEMDRNVGWITIITICGEVRMGLSWSAR